jgi:DNA-binding transcriptional ArsR family regulator
VVAAIAAADPAELKLAILGYYRRAFRMVTSPAVIRDASAGDRKAITELRGSSYPYLRHWQRTLRYVLATDATALRARLAEALRTWRDVVFAELEPTLRATDEADVVTTSERVATHPLDQVLEAIVPGLTFAREVGQSMVVLVPSVVVRPSFALADYGSTLVIAYPAAAPAVARDDGKRLATLADALGDELRVQVLGELRRGPVSTSELARRLGVPRTSLQHHLSVLVNAGLAAMAVDDARTGALELRRDRLLELARLAERIASVEDAAGTSIPSGDEADQT